MTKRKKPKEALCLGCRAVTIHVTPKVLLVEGAKVSVTLCLACRHQHNWQERAGKKIRRDRIALVPGRPANMQVPPMIGA